MDVEELIKIKYPKHPDERKCRTLRNRMEALREIYRQRLLNESATATIIRREEPKTDEAI